MLPDPPGRCFLLNIYYSSRSDLKTDDQVTDLYKFSSLFLDSGSWEAGAYPLYIEPPLEFAFRVIALPCSPSRPEPSPRATPSYTQPAPTAELLPQRRPCSAHKKAPQPSATTISAAKAIILRFHSRSARRYPSSGTRKARTLSSCISDPNSARCPDQRSRRPPPPAPTPA